MSSKEAYKYEGNGLESPALNAVDLDSAKSDAVDLTESTRAVYTGAGGTMIVNMEGTGTSITFANLPAGVVLPVRVKRVLSTGTTATGLVGLY